MPAEITRSPEIARVEAEIAEARERVVHSVRALRSELSRRSDWREWVARRPVTLCATAFALGFILGNRR